MARSIRGRLRRLESAPPEAGPRIHWDNLYARGPEEVVPDGVIDWHGMFAPRLSEVERRTRCPIEFVIWRVSQGEAISVDEAKRRIEAGERCPPEAELGRR